MKKTKVKKKLKCKYVSKKHITKEGVYIANNSILPYISVERKRETIPNDVIKIIKKRLKNLPKNSFSKKEIDKKYYWKGVNNNLSNCTLDLPIIEVDIKSKYKSLSWKDKKQPNWEIIKKSCIIADKKSKILLAIFVYTKDDPNITKCVEDSFELVKLIEKYLKLKNKIFYSGFDTKLKDKKSVKLDRQDRYTGKNWLEGMQRYLDPSCGHNILAYYKRHPEANKDKKYLELLLWQYCCLYELEKRHCPSVAQFRYDLVKDSNFPGCFTPSCPLELNPSTCMGASINFSSDTHADSSVEGTTETIIWRPDKTRKKPYLFGNSLIEKSFSIHDDCMIYQVGTDPHGTLNTGNHGGVGFVNLSKKNLVNNTPYNKKWYDLWNKFFKL